MIVSGRTRTSNFASQLNVWVAGCPHIPTDTSVGRSSATTAISDIENKIVRVDLGLILGDFSGSATATSLAGYATQGEDCATQLSSGTKYLTRNKIYTIRGNHDAGAGNNNWYDRYIDRNGVNTAYSGVTNSLRPYPLIDPHDDYYAIQTGNILWLMLDDINDCDGPCGRDGGGSGGYPSGTTSLEAYNWWVSMIEANPDKIIITCAHHLLKNTTIATGDSEGVDGSYHGSSGQPVGSGRLHNIMIDEGENEYEEDQTRFMDYLTTNNSASALWLGAHTHYDVGETYNNRGWINTTNGCTFINVGGLTLHHEPKNSQSKILTFTEGSNVLKVTNVLHDTGFANTGYNGSGTTVTLPMIYKP